MISIVYEKYNKLLITITKAIFMFLALCLDWDNLSIEI